MARRLVEKGVPFITINYRGWDTHKQHFQTMRRRLPEMDRGMATLLEDLAERGLLDSTIVWWSGEFGRQPEIENGDGRSHNADGFTLWMAGGGIKGGVHFGASDEFGYKAVENRVGVNDLHATILHVMGLDHELLTWFHQGRKESLTDVGGHVIQDILA